MPVLIHISLIALVASCDASRLALSQRVIPVRPAAERQFQEGSPALPHFIQESVRTKRSSVHELVRAQPHLVHDMGRPEVLSRSQAQTNASQSNPPSPVSQDRPRTAPAADQNLDVEEEMERMVHLVTPQDSARYVSDPETELFNRPGAGDASQEASGFYGTDMEDRERRGGDEEEEERKGGRDDPDALEANRTTPDLDALIGYSPFFHPSSSEQRGSTPPPAEVPDSGLQEHRAPPVLEVGPTERELLEAEAEEDAKSSGYGLLHSSIMTVRTTSSAADGGDAAGTATPETDTGTDFGLLGSYTKDETEDEGRRREEEEEDAGLAHTGEFSQNPTVPEIGMAPSREPLQPSVEGNDAQHKLKETEGQRTRHVVPLTTEPPPTSFTWDGLEKTSPLPAHRSKVGGGRGVTGAVPPASDVDELLQAQQVVCVDWSELTGRGYIVLNLMHNFNCEEFRVNHGVRLLKIMEEVFARRMNSPEGSWVLYLSKPTHQQHQLLMNVASEQGVITTKEVLMMLGQIRKSLNKVGIQNYSAASSCQSRPSQTRSDYGKLFVVLVIIGSVCMVIITSGFIYICWQRRLPATKTTFRAEELHFVENGCHDNPMLDVTNDPQPEMQEKKPSTNGLAGGGGEGGREDGSRWQVFVNQAATEEEEEEQDTHL